MAIVKCVAYTDFIDPTKMLADGLEMTSFALWMWHFIAVLIFEFILAMFFVLFFDDDAGHEVVVMTLMAMSLVSACSIYSVREHLSGWMGLSRNLVWFCLGIMIGVCMIAIVSGRMRGTRRTGYEGVN